MLTKEKTGKIAVDIQTGETFELETEVEYDILAATFSCIYLIAMLIFFCWLFLDLVTGRNFFLKLIFPQSADSIITPLFRLIFYTVIGGGLGGVVNGIRSFISWHAERRSFGWRFVWKYITLPLLGFVLAGTVYAIIRGGIAGFGVGFAPDDNFITQAMTAFGVGALSGYGSHKVFRWLDNLVNKIFKTVKVLDVKVPDLVGKTLEEAKEILKESNLNLGKTDEKPSKDPAKVGKVIDQDPKADAMIHKGGSVSITIAKKPDKAP